MVQHPDYGLFQYTKMPQGWIQSPSQLRCFLQQILWKHKNNVRRYMDDIIIFGKSREELVRSFSGVLATLEYHNLRVNGKKVTALGTSYSILGRKIENGRVFASPHIIENLNKGTETKTEKKLRGETFDIIRPGGKGGA